MLESFLLHFGQGLTYCHVLTNANGFNIFRGDQANFDGTFKSGLHFSPSQATIPCPTDALGVPISGSVPDNPDLFTGLLMLTLDLTGLFTFSVQGTSDYPNLVPVWITKPFTSFVALLWTHSSILPKLRLLELVTALKVWPYHCQLQKKNHFPPPAGHTIPDPGQDAIGPLGHLGTPWLMFTCCHQNPQVPFCLGTVQPHRLQLITLQGVVVAKMQDLELDLVKPCITVLGPSIQLVQVPLQGPPTLQQIDTRSQLGVICKFADGGLDPLIQIISKDIKQDWAQH
ncbi:hypothetical protein HGM15179_004392 [Zosterops borbonicus]|uniref:Uncharacterized protein n=1 Tax=Zosterops borbonicus TaxID=364589 RepID=A0A8K1LQL0_9PASS|nr:hypothetical protein HGM15179_004392 [Zosterops borbonicus]